MAEAAKKRKLFDSRYEVLGIVGRGASSVVYRAQHVLSNNKEVALKVIVEKSGGRDLPDHLRHEALAMITARHKYTVRLEDFRSIDSVCYLAMEYAPLSDLRAYSKNSQGKLHLLQAERFFRQICEALAFMHGIGMLHRDIKPENILVLNDRQARLSDFGVATLPGQKPSHEELKQGVGTLDYMAPEIFSAKEITPASDVYSLCLSFYELISGTHPFKDLPLAEALLAREDTQIKPLIELVPEVPSYISSAIQKGLSYEPADRFKNADEILTYINSGVFTNGDFKPAAARSAEIHTGETSEAFIAETPETETNIEELSAAEATVEPAPAPAIQQNQILKITENSAVQQTQSPEVRDSAFGKLVVGLMLLAICFMSYRFFIQPQIETEPAQLNINRNSFPFLPKGVYSGILNGGLSAGEVPLSLYALDERNSLLVLIGIEGFQPQVINLNELPTEILSQGSLLVASGGQELLLTAPTGTTSGAVKNLSLGTTGSFELKSINQS